MEKIYANMAACHLKAENWKRAIESADKVYVLPTTSQPLRSFRPSHRVHQALTLVCHLQALAKNADNTKALFRKGKAQGELGFFEKALKTLEDVKKKNPAGT